MVDLQSIFKIGQLVHIEIVNNEGLATRYPSRIENIDEDLLTLAGPIKNRRPLYVPAGSYVDVWYWDNVAIYTFRASVVQSVHDKVPLLVLNKPDNIERVQKREFVRVQCSLNVLLRYKNKEGQEQELLCRTRDVSAGGMMLVLTKPAHLKKDDEVSLRFELKEETYELTGRIVWNDWELGSDGIERNILGVQFTGLDEKVRLKLIKFVYQRQIEHRQRGLL